MQQKLIMKPSMSQTLLTRFTFNIPDIDGLFPGFKAGDFAVLYGPQSLNSLTSLLCVRAQQPAQLGGLESNVVFIDCANSSSLSNIQLQQLDAKDPLERVLNMRVYTAYRLTSRSKNSLQPNYELPCKLCEKISHNHNRNLPLSRKQPKKQCPAGNNYDKSKHGAKIH
jgi:hypothetical protein